MYINKDLDEIKDVSTEEIIMKYPNFFDYSGDINGMAYLNWRFDKHGNFFNHFSEMGGAYFKVSIHSLDKLISYNGDKEADAWIFPVLFNIMHGIELYLKSFNASTKILIHLYKRKYEDVKIEGRHNIKQLCEVALNQMKKLNDMGIIHEEEKYVSFKNFKFIEKFIDLIYEKTENIIDFRYPLNTNQKETFYVNAGENITINLFQFKIWSLKVFGILDDITEYIDYRIDNLLEVRGYENEEMNSYRDEEISSYIDEELNSYIDEDYY